MFIFRKKLRSDWSMGTLAIIPRTIFRLRGFIFKNLNIKSYRIINLPVVLFVYEIWSLKLREDLGWKRLRTGCWVGNLALNLRGNREYTEKLTDLYWSPNNFSANQIDKNELYRVLRRGETCTGFGGDSWEK